MRRRRCELSAISPVSARRERSGSKQASSSHAIASSRRSPHMERRRSQQAARPPRVPTCLWLARVLVRMDGLLSVETSLPGVVTAWDTDRYISRQEGSWPGFGHAPGVVRRWTLLRRAGGLGVREIGVKFSSDLRLRNLPHDCSFSKRFCRLSTSTASRITKAPPSNISSESRNRSPVAAPAPVLCRVHHVRRCRISRSIQR
ncbi:hypothetical protein B0T16DRAFT_144917 [Cercophora newfieldiana]|uniref:Uncharacterized protein n=1 Tax=Cercophora newfieldiana TaxID=92897 RepID=A0AA40CQL5_9PEZI|nr:hypothetical protein B0T16DRAFT_144917 [Cercophora newfieldiana]